MNIIDCIDRYMKKSKYDVPLFSDDIYKYVNSRFLKLDKKTFNTYLSRYINKNSEVKRHSKGIYFKKKETVFGSTNIDFNLLLVNTYIKNKDCIFGYETGPSLFNKLGLTTQIPNKIYLVTNHNRKKIGDDNKINLIKPIQKINNDNYKYYQFLDILLNKYNVNIESSNYYGILKKYMKDNELDFKNLLRYSVDYKNKELLSKIALLSTEI